MPALPASSGNLTADRRLPFVDVLAAEGDFVAAAQLMRDTLDLVPDWAAGWYRLGELAQAAGQADAAAEAFRTALRLDPADRFGAGWQLTALTGEATAAASGFVETLFDLYAPDFESALVGRLGYRAPGLLAAVLDGQSGFAHALDLGCGTGLMGPILRPLAARLDGWDLSARMLQEAAAKGLYDHLEKRDIAAPGPVAGRFDLVTAADVFLYLGDLAPVFDWLARAMVPGGVLTFTTERSDSLPVALQPSRRYAHSETYLRQTLAAAGFADVVIGHDWLRTDRGQPVAGLIVSASRPGAARHRRDGETREGQFA